MYVDPHHLLGYHDDGLCGKPPIAVVEQIFKRRPQKIDD